MHFLIPYLCLEHNLVIPAVNSDRFIFFRSSHANPPLPAEEYHYNGLIAARHISTYPVDTQSANKPRMGDPIADQFAVLVRENAAILSLADGCSWGERPRAAARTASLTFLSYLSQSDIRDTGQAGEVLLAAFSSAHEKIVEGLGGEWWKAGELRKKMKRSEFTAGMTKLCSRQR